MKHLLLKLAPHFLWLCVIIALLILMQRGCGERDAAKADARQAHTLRRIALDQAAADRAALDKYRQDSAVAAQRTQQATKRADSIDKTRKLLEREIKQLYGLLKQPYDTTIIDSTCCTLANDLVTANELHRAEDSLKDAATLDQLDLATTRIDTLQQQRDRWRGLYEKRDSLPTIRAGGSMWFGVEGQVGPVSSGGLYLKWQTGKGKEYTISGGRQPMGWYGSVKLGTKISLRKKR